MTLAALLVAKVERLAEAASPGPWSNLMALAMYDADGVYLADFYGAAPQRERGANAALAVAFGSPDRALAIVKALMLNAKTPCLLNECGQCAQCISRALIRDLAAALGVEEERDGS